MLEIRKSFSRSNLWEKRQIIRLIDSTFDEEEKRPWLKNIRQIESNELFLLETAEPIKLTKKKEILKISSGRIEEEAVTSKGVL